MLLSFIGNLPLQVHSTIENAILPSSDEYGSTDDVLNWLQTTLTNIWMDSVCGDGVCETPFEFAAYGRFGCRADCGQLAQIQNLTTLQIDLYYDFTHPSGSVSASVRACPCMDSCSRCTASREAACSLVCFPCIWLAVFCGETVCLA